MRTERTLNQRRHVHCRRALLPSESVALQRITGSYWLMMGGGRWCCPVRRSAARRGGTTRTPSPGVRASTTPRPVTPPAAGTAPACAELGLIAGCAGAGGGAGGAVRARPAPGHRGRAGAGVALGCGDRARPDVLGAEVGVGAVGARRRHDRGSGRAPRTPRRSRRRSATWRRMRRCRGGAATGSSRSPRPGSRRRCSSTPTSRTGDPQLHTHALVVNKVRCADGVWRTDRRLRGVPPQEGRRRALPGRAARRARHPPRRRRSDRCPSTGRPRSPASPTSSWPPGRPAPRAVMADAIPTIADAEEALGRPVTRGGAGPDRQDRGAGHPPAEGPPRPRGRAPGPVAGAGRRAGLGLRTAAAIRPPRQP